MSTLYIVPTPIGNLKDITLRAIDVLKEVNYIACEDTRRTLKLLNFYGIKGKKLLSYYYPKEKEKIKTIVKILKEGKDVALVSDAGTPLVSDPGYILVKECLRESIQVEALPGATAFMPALISSGLPTDKFLFVGFPPKKGTKNFWEKVKHCKDTTIIFYESHQRLPKSLLTIREVFGNVPTVIGREISKFHEEFIRGSLDEVIGEISNRNIKGEIVVVFRWC